MLWDQLVSLITPYATVASAERVPFELATMLGIHSLQQRFALSDLSA
jgi:hypothetical protein